jgi:hypothetical protein
MVRRGRDEDPVSGVRNMAKGLATLNKMKSAMRGLPIRVRTAVAKDGESKLTNETRGDFESGRTVFGEPRRLGVKGQALSLVKSGRTAAALRFVAVGTILRAHLPTKHAKYLIGKYKILPSGRSLPAAWRAELESSVREQVRVFQQEIAP